MNENWQTEERCTECDAIMSSKDVWENSGVCPYCGYKGDSRAYATTRVVRFKMDQIANDILKVKPPWWAFWRKSESLMKPTYEKKIHPDDVKEPKES